MSSPGRKFRGPLRLSRSVCLLGLVSIVVVGLLLSLSFTNMTDGVLTPIKVFHVAAAAQALLKFSPATSKPSISKEDEKYQIARARFVKEMAATFAHDNWGVWMRNNSRNESVANFTKIDGSKLFQPRFPGDDRIADTLNYIPDGYTKTKTKDKLILLWHGYTWEQENYGACIVDSCSFTRNRSRLSEADAVVFHHPGDPNMPRRNATRIPQSQVWILSMRECPYNSFSMKKQNDVFNWTATYRWSSTFPYVYGKFFLYNESVKALPQPVNYATGKTSKVAWIVSNCMLVRNLRNTYAQELTKYTYRGYITEKLFRNALDYNVLPVVMGAHPDDYRRTAPHNSFLHVDDFESPKHLAEYLHLLDKHDHLYNQYFAWKGTGSLIAGNAHKLMKWCQLCALLHAPKQTLEVNNPEMWWRGNNVCIGRDSWRKYGYEPLKKYVINNGTRFLKGNFSGVG